MLHGISLVENVAFFSCVELPSTICCIFWWLCDRYWTIKSVVYMTIAICSYLGGRACYHVRKHVHIVQKNISIVKMKMKKKISDDNQRGSNMNIRCISTFDVLTISPHSNRNSHVHFDQFIHDFDFQERQDDSALELGPMNFRMKFNVEEFVFIEIFIKK